MVIILLEYPILLRFRNKRNHIAFIRIVLIVSWQYGTDIVRFFPSEGLEVTPPLLAPSGPFRGPLSSSSRTTPSTLRRSSTRPAAFGNLENLFIQYTHKHTLEKKIYCQEMGEKIINKFFVLYFGLPVVVLPLLLPLRLCPRPAHLPPPPPLPLFVLFTSCLYFVAGFVIYSKSVPFWLYIENKYIHISTRACIRIYKYTNIHMYVCMYVQVGYDACLNKSYTLSVTELRSSVVRYFLVANFISYL